MVLGVSGNRVPGFVFKLEKSVVCTVIDNIVLIDNRTDGWVGIVIGIEAFCVLAEVGVTLEIKPPGNEGSCVEAPEACSDEVRGELALVSLSSGE